MTGLLVGGLGLAVWELWCLRNRKAPSGTVADLRGDRR